MIRACSGCGADNRVPLSRLAQEAKCGRCKQPLGPPSAPIELESDDDFQTLLANAPYPILVDFWAAWCGPCRVVAPELVKLAQSKAGKVLIAKVDTEALPLIASRFNIRSIPTLIRFDNGSETKRVSGAMRAEQLAQAFGL